MVARDRERGTLALLLSQPVAPRTLLLGKGIAAALLSGAVVLPPFLWSMACSAGPCDGWRLVGLAIAQMLGIACFAGVALLASVRASTRCDALVGSFLIWAASCLALPRLVSEFAAFRHPLPTRDALAAAVREDVRHGIDGHDPQDERRKALEEETLRKHGVAALDELPFNFDALVMNEDERYRSGVYDRHFGAVWDAMEAQERARLVAAIAMPVVAIEHASAVLCDTDLGSARRFNEAAVAWRDQLMYFLNDEMAAKSRTGDWEWKAAPETWARIEPFIAPVRAGREALRAAATPLLWLAIAALAPWLLALRSARRLAP
jgi:ABC-2 type transport system permease protein